MSEADDNFLPEDSPLSQLSDPILAFCSNCYEQQGNRATAVSLDISRVVEGYVHVIIERPCIFDSVKGKHSLR